MSELVIKKFGAAWCKPCKAMSKVFEEILPSYSSNITFIDIDIEENDEQVEKYQIRSIPVVVFEKDGKILERVNGSVSGSEIKKLIDEYIKSEV